MSSNLHPVFDEILQSFVAPPQPRPKARSFRVTVSLNGIGRCIVTRALSASDAVMNIVDSIPDGEVSIVVKPVLKEQK